METIRLARRFKSIYRRRASECPEHRKSIQEEFQIPHLTQPARFLLTNTDFSLNQQRIHKSDADRPSRTTQFTVNC